MNYWEDKQFLVYCIGFCIFIIFSLISLAKLKKWQRRRAHLNSLLNKRETLLRLRNETLFHLDWAKERGEPYSDFQDDLLEYDDEIDSCNSTMKEIV